MNFLKDNKAHAGKVAKTLRNNSPAAKTERRKKKKKKKEVSILNTQTERERGKKRSSFFPSLSESLGDVSFTTSREKRKERARREDRRGRLASVWSESSYATKGSPTPRYSRTRLLDFFPKEQTQNKIEGKRAAERSVSQSVSLSLFASFRLSSSPPLLQE